MLTNKILIIGLSMFSVFLSDCRWFGVRGNGHIESESRAITDFSEIYADGMFDVEWQQGAPALTVKCDENLLNYVEASVSDNRLRLHVRERILPTHGLKVTVTSSTRTGAKLRGASELKAQNLTGQSFAVETTGAADVTLDGAVDFLLADMTGASDLKAKSLQVKTAEISTTGAADAEVSPSESLRVNITGAGSVLYHGQPKNIEKHVTGAGEVRHKD